MATPSPRIFGLALALLAAAWPLPGRAGISGRQKDQYATAIYQLYYTLAANTSYTIETQNLSGSSDTVLHVQNADANYSYLAGNDDYGGPRSLVTIGSSPSARSVVIYVRAYSDTTAGTCDLKITPSPGSPVTFSGISFAGHTITTSTLASSTEVWTVEQQAGTADTVVIVTSANAATAIAADDDDGVDRMSWMSLPTSCIATCRIVIGRYAGGADGNTTAIWDGDGAGPDCDGDTLGDSLEAVLGTTPCNTSCPAPWNTICPGTCGTDSDCDGIPDNIELTGGDIYPYLAKYPYYGADPIKQDLFIEADWRTDALPYDISDAAAWAATYAPTVSVHIDIGPASGIVMPEYRYGNWGGAGPLSPSATECDGFTPTRTGGFHHATIYTGAGSATTGNCMYVPVHQGATAAHETGHNLALQHEGKAPSSGLINGKSIYKSTMNYAFSPSVGFSSNAFSGVTLNPSSVNETTWQGSNSASIAFLRDTLGYKVDEPTKKVDWDFDRQFSASGIKASATWKYDAARHRYTVFPGSLNETDAAMAWLPATSPRLYLLTRRTSGQIAYRYVTQSQMGSCSAFVADARTACVPTGAWTADAFVPLPTGVTASGPVSATWYTDNGGVSRLFVVYRDNSARLQRQEYTVAGGWGSAYVVDNNTGLQGDVFAIASPDKRSVYVFSSATVGSNKQIHKWTYNSVNGVWTNKVPQVWSGGSAVNNNGEGAGLTLGYERNNPSAPGLQVYAAIGDPSNVLTTARVSGDTWYALPGTPSYYLNKRPGIAYVPFNAGTPSDGRFYVLFSNTAVDPLLVVTEGNWANYGANDVRRLVWLQFTDYPIPYDHSWGETSLLFDLAYDDHLRGLMIEPGACSNNGAACILDSDCTSPYTCNKSSFSGTWFSPLVDGSNNASFTDEDDWYYIKRNQRCALSLSPPCL